MGRRTVSVLCATVMVVAAVSACGSNPKSSSGSAPPAAMQTLTITYAGFSSQALLSYIAKKEGFFTKSGVDVTIKDGLGDTANTLVFSGQADLVGLGPMGTALSTAAKGQDTTFLAAVVGGAQAGYVVGNPKTAPTLDALKALDKCTLNTWIVGSAPYAYAVELKKKYALKCDIVPYGDVPSELAAVIAGRGDAAVAAYSTFAAAINAKQVVSIVDTRDKAAAAASYGPSVIDGGTWGLTRVIKSKALAVTAYLRGTQLAYEWLQTHSDTEVATIFRSFPGFSTQTVDALVPQVAAARAYIYEGTPLGNFTQQQWTDSVEFVASSGIAGFVPTAAVNSFANRVDLSYLEKAAAK